MCSVRGNPSRPQTRHVCNMEQVNIPRMFCLGGGGGHVKWGLERVDIVKPKVQACSFATA